MADPSKIKIVAVDDNEAHSYLVSKLLAKAGYSVQQAFTGDEMFSLVGPDTDLVVLDVHLPDSNGFDLCRRLRANPTTARVPIIFLSSTTQLSEGRKVAAEVGAQDFLAHPCEPSELLNVVKQVLQESTIH